MGHSWVRPKKYKRIWRRQHNEARSEQQKAHKVADSCYSTLTGSWNSGRCSNVCVFPSSLDKAFPGQNGDPELQKTSYANGLSVAQKVEEEGAVLLKNDGALPLAGTNRKINLLGYASANPVYGGTGSGGSSYTQTGQIL